ncbi:hypothetical protein [Modestobacter sp. SSW1-42]|uniref:hypothetical protein n=1 Tax=Modestobacter sp. SSW1-42 TaxID=596372 RepID=UPI00398599AE
MVEGRVRVQAARWVLVLGRVTTALLVVGAVGAALAAWGSWSAAPLLLTALSAGLAAGWHALLTAFERHGRGAWTALLAWSAADALARLGGALPGGGVGAPDLLGGLLDVVLLGLLLHPDSRDWVARPPGPASSRGGPVHSPGTAGMPHDHRRPHVQVTEELP